MIGKLSVSQGVYIDTPNEIRATDRKATPEPRCCAGCGEPSGSVSEGTGFPLVRDRESELMYHVRCLPGNLFLDAQWSCLERMAP
jgi:hypothetical protein